MSGTRAITQEVLVAAPAAAVWRALSTAEGIENWFAPQAEVVPGVGGSIWLSWGPGAEGRAALAVWQPERRIAWFENYDGVHFTIEFALEPRGDATNVRLVHDGFGTDADTDAQFRLTQSGWRYFLFNLKHALELHPHARRIMVSVREKVNQSADSAFAALTGAAGLAAAGSLPLQQGERFRVTTAAGDVLEGTVVLVYAPVHLALHIENLNDALLLLEMEPAEDARVRPALWLSLYDVRADHAAALQDSMTRLYRSALTPAGPIPA
jgi:uncharacterized protein YndB with AHSA1/START domain